jgi:hypothetical protein
MIVLQFYIGLRKKLFGEINIIERNNGKDKVILENN